MFKSDFKVVADYFIQIRKNKDYKPSRQILKHVHEVLQLMAVFTKDRRFEEYQNQFIEGENATMCDILDKAEEKGRTEGKLSVFVNLQKNFQRPKNIGFRVVLVLIA